MSAALQRVGVQVVCTICGCTKKPIGQSAPLSMSFCTDECAGYRKLPYPGSLWPNETEKEFGYPVGSDGTKEALLWEKVELPVRE